MQEEIVNLLDALDRISNIYQLLSSIILGLLAISALIPMKNTETILFKKNIALKS